MHPADFELLPKSGVRNVENFVLKLRPPYSNHMELAAPKRGRDKTPLTPVWKPTGLTRRFYHNVVARAVDATVVTLVALG